jgi:hypothetical protein
MGEAKRRRESITEPGEIIPDCLFFRDFEAEAEGGYTLAGQIIVRQPRPLKEHMERIGPAIQAAIARLVAARREDPDLDIALLNLDGSETNVGDKIRDGTWLRCCFDLPPSQRVMVRVDPNPPAAGQIRLSDYDLKLIMGTH